MKKRYIFCKSATKTASSAQLRENFLIDDLFSPNRIDLYYIDCDRTILGSACPVSERLELLADSDMRSEYFCKRREIGILNIGGTGSVEVDKKVFKLGHLEMLYIGRGSQKIFFETENPENPAEFYLLSYPAHAEYPSEKAERGDANILRLGDKSHANIRQINQVICPNKIRSCQLVMGYTQLSEGSVWNTMPAHTHERRSEIYLYFGIAPEERVFHFMGDPQETRHIAVGNKNIVISPPWSIHSGCGTANYTFCWGMGGENQHFADMDEIPTNKLI